MLDSALTIEEATKLIVSAGLVVPRRKMAPGVPVPEMPAADALATAAASQAGLLYPEGPEE